MKKLFKWTAKIAIIALMLSIIAPAMDYVQAASKIILKSGKVAPNTIYTGRSYSLKVSNATVKFYSSDKTVATVGISTGKLKPIATGKVTITAKNKKTGKVVAKKTFTVNQRANVIDTDVKEVFLNLNETQTIKATLTPATSTDVVRFYSSDKLIATVGLTSGKITAKASGMATIKVLSKATKATKNNSKYNKVTTVKVYVGSYTDTVCQTAKRELKVIFKNDMSSYNLTPSDFTVINDETKVKVGVSTVKVNGKEVTLTLTADIADGQSYTVIFKDQTVSFTATDGKIAKLTIVPQEIPVASETPIYVALCDANGVILDKYSIVSSNTPDQISSTISLTAGYYSSTGLYLPSDKATATVNVTYHTWKYVDGKEVDVISTGDVVIKASADIKKTEKKEESKNDSSTPSIPSNPISFKGVCSTYNIELPNHEDLDSENLGDLGAYSYVVSGAAIRTGSKDVLEYFAATGENQTLTKYPDYQVAVKEVKLYNNMGEDVTGRYYKDGKIVALSAGNAVAVNRMPAGTYKLQFTFAWKVGTGNEQISTDERDLVVSEAPSIFDNKVTLVPSVQMNQTSPYNTTTDNPNYQPVSDVKVDIASQLGTYMGKNLYLNMVVDVTTTGDGTSQTLGIKTNEVSTDEYQINLGNVSLKDKDNNTLISFTNQDDNYVYIVKFDSVSDPEHILMNALENGTYTATAEVKYKGNEPGAKEITKYLSTKFNVTGVPEIEVIPAEVPEQQTSVQKIVEKNLKIKYRDNIYEVGEAGNLEYHIQSEDYSYNEAEGTYAINAVEYSLKVGQINTSGDSEHPSYIPILIEGKANLLEPFVIHNDKVPLMSM